MTSFFGTSVNSRAPVDDTMVFSSIYKTVMHTHAYKHKKIPSSNTLNMQLKMILLVMHAHTHTQSYVHKKYHPPVCWTCNQKWSCWAALCIPKCRKSLCSPRYEHTTSFETIHTHTKVDGWRDRQNGRNWLSAHSIRRCAHWLESHKMSHKGGVRSGGGRRGVRSGGGRRGAVVSLAVGF